MNAPYFFHFIESELEQLDLKNTIACEIYMHLYMSMSNNLHIILDENKCKKICLFCGRWCLEYIGHFFERGAKMVQVGNFPIEGCCEEIWHIKQCIVIF